MPTTTIPSCQICGRVLEIHNRSCSKCKTPIKNCDKGYYPANDPVAGKIFVQEMYGNPSG